MVRSLVALNGLAAGKRCRQEPEMLSRAVIMQSSRARASAGELTRGVGTERRARATDKLLNLQIDGRKPALQFIYVERRSTMRRASKGNPLVTKGKSISCSSFDERQCREGLHRRTGDGRV
jgi:hypothetical protein